MDFFFLFTFALYRTPLAQGIFHKFCHVRTYVHTHFAFMDLECIPSIIIPSILKTQLSGTRIQYSNILPYPIWSTSQAAFSTLHCTTKRPKYCCYEKKYFFTKFHNGHFLGLVLLCWGKKSQNCRI